MDNKAPQSNPFTQRIAKNKVPPPGGKVVAPATKRGAFPTPARAVVWFSDGQKPGCPVFAAKGGIKNGAPQKGAHLASTHGQPTNR